MATRRSHALCERGRVVIGNLDWSIKVFALPYAYIFIFDVLLSCVLRAWRPTLGILRLDPLFDHIRNDSRFQKLAASPIPNDAKQ